MAKQRGLGKGLGAIFAENETEDGSSSIELNINELEPNRAQPRRHFDEEKLAELADSISRHGMLQPLLVRPLPGGGYQIVAGERRWRAARMAGLKLVPALVRDLDEQQVTELALIENLQREDLNPMEESLGYADLMNKFQMTQEQVAEAVGKSRPAVANALRLQKLPASLQKYVAQGELSAGQGRAILAFPAEKQESVAKLCMQGGLTVRDLEKLSREQDKKAPREPSIRRANPFYEEAALSLHERLGRHVKVAGNGKKGTLTIEFQGEEDLKNLLQLFAE